jgi:broad specificity phosphatase PhoE
VTTLLLVRHGETDWNAEGRLQGHTDTPLNELGRRQALTLADELAGDGIEAVYSSDLARARETAEIVAERLRLAVVLDPDLREKDWGT